MGVAAAVPGGIAATFSAEGDRLFVLTGAPALHQIDGGGAVIGMARLAEPATDIAVYHAGSAPVVALPGSGQLAPIDVDSGGFGEAIAPLPRASRAYTAFA